MTNDATTTIVIPSFNAIAQLPDCIESAVDVLGDKLGSDVLIHIQDGASTDGTTEYLGTLSRPGISHSIEPDEGIYDAMNRAVNRIATPFAYFLGADDRLQPDFLAMLPHLQDSGRVYYGNVLFSYDMKPYDGPFNRTKLVYRNICHQAIFYPTGLLKARPYNTNYRIYGDWALNIQLMAETEFRHFDLNIALYENTGGASARQQDQAFERDRHQLFRRYFGLPYYLLSVTAPLAVSIYQAISPLRRPDYRKS